MLLGGLQAVGRSAIVADHLRVYGGGGVLAGARPARPSGDASRVGGVTGGGFVGLEFLIGPHWSATIEVGGQGSVHPGHIDAGPSVMGGFLIYP